MENKNPSRKSFVVFIVVVLVVSLVLGQLIASNFINGKYRTCGLLQAGLQQVGNQQDPTLQTAFECVRVVTAVELLTRLVAAIFSLLITALFAVSKVAISELLEFNRNYEAAKNSSVHKF